MAANSAADSAASPSVPQPKRAQIEVEVRYAETDQMGHVHHSVHVIWFELARTALCARTGCPYHEIEEMGYFLLVTGVGVRYVQPVRYGSTVQLECWMESYGSRKLKFGYTIHQDGRKVAVGHTEHIWFDRERQRPCRIPEKLKPAFQRLLAA